MKFLKFLISQILKLFVLLRRSVRFLYYITMDYFVPLNSEIIRRIARFLFYLLKWPCGPIGLIVIS